jgi:hypothetical protein
MTTKPTTVRCYTTAEIDYDWFGTREIDPDVGNTTGGRQKIVRLVEIPTERADAQRGRYGSGLHLVADDAEWAKLVGYGLVDVRDYASECAHRGQAAQP